MTRTFKKFMIFLLLLLFSPSLLLADDPAKDPFYTEGHLINAPQEGSVYEYVDPFSGYLALKKDFYKPFGEEQSVTSYPENDMKFVGKEKDAETGLYYFGARYMRPEIGRFISPDPMWPVDPRTSKTNYKMLDNPQKLNRYTYGLNNPYRYVDPDGEAAIEVKNFLETRQQLLGWAPSWLQEILMPLDISIGPMAIKSGGEKAIGKGLSEAAKEAFEVAKTGGRHSGLLKEYMNKSTIEIQRALRSYEKQVTVHAEKLNDPARFAEGLSKMEPRAQEGLLRHWQQDLRRNLEFSEIMRGILRERGIE
jgi:RHS repeat-associated protein